MPPNVDATELWLTIAVLLGGGGIITAMARLERRPRQSLEPRMIPTTPVMLVGAGIVLLAFVHLLNLWGINTGRQ